MLTTLQIVLLSVTGAFALATLVLFIMFVVEISVEANEEKEEVKSVYSTENYVVTINEEKEDSVDDMLAKLEEDSKEEKVEEEKIDIHEMMEDSVEEKEEIVEEKEESIENLAEIDENDEDETSDDDDEALLTNIEELKTETHEPIVAGSVIDYKTRLEKIIENRNKIDRDLSKIQKSILKYERTKRRKNRNQKMLDRRAGELTNLNLVMYSVTDIKNVDEDKKVKQEELTAHIAELKASIQDAEEFIESNKEKNDHNVKMAKFLIQEKARYNEEIAELQELINKTDDTSVSA